MKNKVTKIALVIAVLMTLTETNLSFSNDVQEDSRNEIPIRDKTYNLIQKRKKEAESLFFEGLELHKKGQKLNREDLIIEGQLKKKISRERLSYLKEQELKHKNREETDVK